MFSLRSFIGIVGFVLALTLTEIKWPSFPRISAAKQSDGVLVHGGLCPAQLPGQQDRILKHVRATHSERPVYRLHAQR
jgi:hypothetical protein